MSSRLIPAVSILVLASACSGKVVSRGSDKPAGSDRGDTNDPGVVGAMDIVGVRRTPSAEQTAMRCQQSKVAPPLLRRLTRTELEKTLVDVFPGIAGRWRGVRLGPDPSSALHFSNDADLLVVGTQTAVEVLRTAKEVAALVVTPDHLAGILPCARSNPQQDCAEKFLDLFGRRLYRRPLTADEHEELVEFYVATAAHSDFAVGLKWMLVAILESPAFLYRSEIGDSAGLLDQYELAASLAYVFAGTTPSDDLLTRAAGGALNTPDALYAVARDLLSTERGNQVLRQFFREWAETERVLGVPKDKVANFAEIQRALIRETDLFVDEVVVNGAGSVKDLLTARFTFVDLTLAGFYGVAPLGLDFAKVNRPADRSFGLLAQGSVLWGTAHPSQTSPTQRGLMVFSRLLCKTPPPPPAVVPPLEAPTPANTTRERYEKAHTGSACRVCHAQFDPLGFAFEQFDETGRYRFNENGLAIDTSGSFTRSDGGIQAFKGLDDLSTALAADPGVTDCVSGLMAAYAFGGGGGESCLAETSRAALAAGKIGLREYFLQLSKEPTFVRRTH